MKNVCLFVFLFSGSTFVAQQSFINVPSSEVTRAKKKFFQQQINFNEIIQSNTTLDYGLGQGYEVGVNILGLNFSENRKSFLNNDTNDIDPYNPLVLINGLKQFSLNKNMSIAFGAQLGLNFRKNRNTYEAYLFYTNLAFHDVFIQGSKFVSGIYYNSIHYGGKGTRLCGWLAAEVPLSSKFHAMAESVLGNNGISNTSIGVVYYLKKYMPLTLGYQIPNVKRNSYAVVFELTLVFE